MAEQYIIDQNESKVKIRVFTSDYDGTIKSIEEVIKNGKTEFVEIEKHRSLIIDDLRKGSCTTQQESFILHCIKSASQRQAHLIVKESLRQERIKKWEILTEKEKIELLESHPGYYKKLYPIQDTTIKMYLDTAYAVVNASVSRNYAGHKPLVDKYFSPHSTQEIREYTEKQKEKNATMIGG